MQFTVKVGKEDVLVKVAMSDMYFVYYKDKQAILTPKAGDGQVKWSYRGEEIDEKTVQKIGRAIEKHLGLD